jgi:hypothetical protein
MRMTTTFIPMASTVLYGWVAASAVPQVRRGWSDTGHRRDVFRDEALRGCGGYRRRTKVLVLPRSRRVQLGIETTAQVAPTNGTGHTAAVRRAAVTASPAVGSTRARSIGANAER